MFTDKDEVYVPSAEASAFLTRYNQLAAYGIQGECNCDDVWKHFCPHRIAEHLTSVKQKIEVVAQTLAKAASEPLDAKRQLEEEKVRSEQQEAKRFTFTTTPTIFQSKRQLRRKEIQMHERHTQDLMERKNQLFSELVASGNLALHMEVQKLISGAKLTLRGAIASPYSTDVFNPRTNEKLGSLLLDQRGWMVRLTDGAQSLVGSLLEALVILKDPSQLTLDF